MNIGKIINLILMSDEISSVEVSEKKERLLNYSVREDGTVILKISGGKVESREVDIRLRTVKATAFLTNLFKRGLTLDFWGVGMSIARISWDINECFKAGLIRSGYSFLLVYDLGDKHFYVATMLEEIFKRLVGYSAKSISKLSKSEAKVLLRHLLGINEVSSWGVVAVKLGEEVRIVDWKDELKWWLR